MATADAAQSPRTRRPHNPAIHCNTKGPLFSNFDYIRKRSLKFLVLITGISEPAYEQDTSRPEVIFNFLASHSGSEVLGKREKRCLIGGGALKRCLIGPRGAPLLYIVNGDRR